MKKVSLKKQLRISIPGKGVGNKLSKVRKVNFINRNDFLLLDRHVKAINNMGIVIDYRCASINDNGDMCLNRLKRNKRGAICVFCKSKWIKIDVI